jgi:hypothetical protein
MYLPAGHKTPRRSTRLSSAGAALPPPSPGIAVHGMPEQEGGLPRAQQQEQKRRQSRGSSLRAEMHDLFELEAAGQATPATRLRMLRSRGGKQDG